MEKLVEEVFEKLKKSVSARIQPMPENAVVVNVKVSVEHEIFGIVSQAFIDTANSDLPRDIGVTSDEFKNYLVTLVWSRVCWINRKDRYIVHPTDKINVPSIFSLVLANVGLAQDEKLGVYLEPIMDKPKNLLSKEEMIVISLKLSKLSDRGYIFGLGFPRDRYGSWDFMAMQVVEGKVLRHDSEAHPVYAVISSMLLKGNLATILVPRVMYGFSVQMEQEILSLIRHT